MIFLASWWKEILIALLLAGCAGFFHLWQGQVKQTAAVQAHYDDFVAQTRVIGEKAQAAAIEKDKEHAKNITDALAARDAALAKLRFAASASPRGSVLPAVPAGSASPDRICFQRAGLDAALEQFTGDVAGLAQEGDGAIIDNRAWADSWPK